MSLFNRIRTRLASPQRAPTVRAEPERLSLSAELPLAGSAAPLWRVDLQLLSEPHADGEKLRLRAHFQTNFASGLRQSLSETLRQPEAANSLPQPGRVSLAHRAGQLAQRTATRALDLPGVRAVVRPLLEHDFNTWVEVHATTASLDAGAHELLPQSEKLSALGIRPRRGDDAPMAESWSGQSPGGYAQVSLLQVDKKHLPARLAALLGAAPFHLAATVVNTVEQKVAPK